MAASRDPATGLVGSPSAEAICASSMPSVNSPELVTVASSPFIAEPISLALNESIVEES